ncbi:Ceruloplasmin [Myotis davidii]|uniref:Ceruloplasmin n=1 Tax=Myotis davidii TaxID=225400 RepID=L5LCJ5_MYODS|nr:Ceruloplasmin [Myotis davidii]
MYSFHPHGLTYTKENEGALYPDNTTGLQKEDDHVEPGSQYTYRWFVQERQGPGPNDSNCVTRIYHSHVDTSRDVASGLIGPILTCKRGTLDGDTEKYIDKFYVLMFSQTNENKSWYIDDNINTYTESGQVNATDQSFEDSNTMATINGYMYGNLPNLTMCAEDKVKWYFIGMGDLFDIHPIYLHGQTLLSRNHRKDTITVFPASLEDAFMVAKGPGEWILGCPIYGPVIKAEVGDTLKVTFYNNGSLPLSIQPHGLLYSKGNEGSYYKTPGGSIPPASSHVNPGTTFVYTWQVPRDVGPTSTDPNCLTWLYYSSVYGKKDTNSGLVGPLLVCRKGSLGKDGKQDLNSGLVGPLIVCRKNTTADIVHRVLHFMIFNENESWYLDENINTYSLEPNQVDRNDEDFDLSNQMHDRCRLLWLCSSDRCVLCKAATPRTWAVCLCGCYSSDWGGLLHSSNGAGSLAELLLLRFSRLLVRLLLLG